MQPYNNPTRKNVEHNFKLFLNGHTIYLMEKNALVNLVRITFFYFKIILSQPNLNRKEICVKFVNPITFIYLKQCNATEETEFHYATSS